MARPVPSSPFRACGALLLLALAFAAPAFAQSPEPPRRLWLAWLDGRDLASGFEAGAAVLDRFPDALVVADEKSAQALRSAGFRVEPPIDVPEGESVTLLHADTHAHGSVPDAAAFSAAGATLLWQSARHYLASSRGPLAESEALLRHHRKALRRVPLAPRKAGEPGAGTLATDFSPAIQGWVDQVSGSTMIERIRDLAGVRSVDVGGAPATFTTRSTPTALCDKAEQFVFERLQGLGFSDVQYDPYTFGTTSARNVVATLPGVLRPNRIVLLGAHLDSTSPQASTLAPGANDNASGVAGLLEIARILRPLAFENTLRFVAFTGEEQGLYGSQHYADAAAARGDSIVGVVIFDMIAWKNVLNQIDIEGETAWLPVMNVMNDACARYTSLATSIVLNSWGSDHVPFQDAGFPAFLAIESEYPDYPCYHQTCDTTGWNQAAFGAEVARASLATLAHLAVPYVPTFAIVHTPLATTENTTGPYEVAARITKVSPLVADSLRLHWSAGGPWFEEPLVPTGTPDQYHAFIPGQAATSRVRYWLGAADSAGNHRFSPAGAPSAVHEFWVGTRTALLSEGFEAGASGWTHGGTNDDWQIATPAGLAEDPASAYAGLRSAGTDLTGLGATAGKYENSSDTWLESPAVNCSVATGVRLSFARRLAIERSNGGAWDVARVLVNGTSVWESPSAANLVETAWQPQQIDIASLADGRPSVRVRFTLHSDGSVNFGGWNLDDVQLSGIRTEVTVDAPGVRVAGLRLLPGAPNPARAGASLVFELPAGGEVELTLHDVHGRLVRALARGPRAAGRHTVAWDGLDGAGHRPGAGVYFVRLSAAGALRTGKLVLLP